MSSMKIFEEPYPARAVLGKSDNQWSQLFAYDVHYETIWLVHDSLSSIHELVDSNVTTQLHRFLGL